MELSLELQRHFDKLKLSFSCTKCQRLFTKSNILTTCDHVQCDYCSKPNDYKCYLCKIPFNSIDIKQDLFVETVLRSLQDIEAIFDDAPMSNYDIVVSKVMMKHNHKGETPLHLACKKGDLDQVKELIREGVDMNMIDFANWAPIHEAIQADYPDCVEYLLSEGALSNIPGENYTTPLHKAVSSNKMHIAEILLKYGADVNFIDYTGSKPLHDSLMVVKQDYEITPRVFVGNETVVYAKELTKTEKFKLIKAKVKLATKEGFLTRNDVTHYIYDESLDLDILVCLLKGIFIVNRNWIAMPDKKSFDSIVESYRKPNEASIMNRLLKNPKLFDGMSFYITHYGKQKKIGDLKLCKSHLVTLIQAGGGKILNRPPIIKTTDKEVFYYPFHARGTSLEACDNYVIYHEPNRPELAYNMKELKHRSSEWLLKCILNFKIID